MSKVLLLHGFLGTPEDFEPLRRLLPKEVATFAPTLLGHGVDSSRPIGRIVFEDEVDRLAHLGQDVLGPRATVLGYSLGGRLALGLVARHPAFVDRVIAVGAHPGLDSEVARTARAQSDESWAIRLEKCGLREFVDAWEARPIFASRQRLPPAVKESIHARRLRHDTASLATALRSLSLATMPNWIGTLRRSAAAMDFVVGALDTDLRAVLDGVRRDLPNARFHIVPDVGHDALREAPEAIAAIYRSEGSTLTV